MKKIITTLFGLDGKLYDQLPVSEQKKYGTKLLALIMSVMISNAVAIELSITVFEVTDTLTIVGVCLVWSFLIAAMDIMLIRKAFPGFIRLLFSVAFVAISSMCFFTLITKKDIVNKREKEMKSEINKIRTAYDTAKKVRYKYLETKKDQQLTYHRTICDPESRRIEAGPAHARKHQHCISEMSEIATLEADLNIKEIPYKNDFDNRLAEAKQQNTFGFWEAIYAAWLEIWSDNIKKVGFIALLIILISLESIVFFTSLRTKDLEYQRLQDQDALNQQIISDQISSNTIASKLATERNRNSHRLWVIDNEATRRQKFLELDRKLKDLLLLNHISNEYSNAKRQQPDMNGNIAKSIEMLLANEISNIQNEIDDAIIKSDNFSESHSSATSKNSSNENDETTIENKRKYQNYYTNIFYCTTPMKSLADSFFQQVNGNYFLFAKKVFDWAVENLTYEDTHDLLQYKTSREVYQSKKAICGEMAIFFNSILKYKGFSPIYIHVDVDHSGKKVNHACTGIEINGRVTLMDISYKQFDISHQKWNMVSDSDLVRNIIAWNK